MPAIANRQTSPERYKLSVYVTAVHAIDTAAGTYAADLWIWNI